ncbi:hypothetical protein LUZ61_008954 [Rhynchospora tenuis]|uniref:Late embryogenesis abundant protein LEA-2 subgroup domain-containing protein n=1 Tax=Rhynchospora tenuis TaxID=198213 RepID=A0AAD6EY02_9POAL|nr:hypothetical protein LUZ61_008954 [Rhynchospora tenuis]
MQTEEKLEDPLKQDPETAEPLYTSATTEEPPKKKRKKCICLKISSCILLIIILLLIATFMFFALYLFKKRAVKVTASSATVENLSFTIIPVTLDLVMGTDVAIKNPNYAGYEYENTNTTFYYHGIVAGISPLPAGVVKARSNKKIHLSIYMNATTMIGSPFLAGELIAGQLPLTTNTSLTGKVVLFSTIRFHATVVNSCDVIVNLQTQKTSSNCKSDVKLF